MASEASVTDQTAHEHVEEKKVINDTKSIDEVSLSEPKEIEAINEEEKIKVEEPAISGATATESEEKMEDKNSGIVVEEVKKEEEEEQKASGSDVLAGDGKEVESSKQESDISPALEPTVEVAEKELVNQSDHVSGIPEPPTEAVEKPAEVLEASSPQELEYQAAKELELPESVTEEVKSAEELTEISAAPSSVSEVEDKPTVEVAEKEPVNQPDVSDIPELPSEAIEKPAEVLEASLELESEAAKVLELPESATKEVRSAEELTGISAAPSSVLEAGDKTGEPLVVPTATELASDVIEVVEEKIEIPIASEYAEISQDEKILPEEVETGPKFSTEEVALKETSNTVDDGCKLEDVTDKFQENVASESSDTVTVDATKDNELKEVEEVAVVPEVPSVLEKIDVDPSATGGVVEPKKEESEGAKIEELVKEVAGDASLLDPSPAIDSITATDAGSVSETAESVTKAEVKTEEEQQEKTVDLEKSTPSHMIEAAAEVSEAPSDGEKASEGVELIEEKKDESVEDEKASLVMTSKDIDVEATKTDIDASAEEPVTNSDAAELELKPEETVETVVDKLEKEDTKEEEETEKADNQNVVDVVDQSAKDGGEAKTDGEAPKQEIPAKQRQSNNILSKVKQSIVKVKKAIIGKSPSSKTISTEGKDDIKVK